MNDANQVSPLLQTAKIAVDHQQATLFRGLWMLEQQKLFDRLVKEPLATQLLSNRAQIEAREASVDGFRSHEQHDHLDVVKNAPASESTQCRNSDTRWGRGETTHFTAASHIKTRLLFAHHTEGRHERV